MGLLLIEPDRREIARAFEVHAVSHADMHTTLAAEYLAAARVNPHRPISTPGFADDRGGYHTLPLIDVLADQLAGIGSSAKWAELIGALASCPRGTAFLQRMADEHAAFHADAEVA